MDQRYRRMALFGYETDGGRNSIFWTNPIWYFHQASGQGAKMVDEEYHAWMKTKRPITQEEILSGLWKKISDHGYSFMMRFLPDGTFLEHPLSSESTVVHGTWELAGSVLRTYVEQSEESTLVTYILDIVANKSGSTHSGIEIRNNALNAYFMVFHIL